MEGAVSLDFPQDLTPGPTVFQNDDALLNSQIQIWLPARSLGGPGIGRIAEGPIRSVGNESAWRGIFGEKGGTHRTWERLRADRL